MRDTARLIDPHKYPIITRVLEHWLSLSAGGALPRADAFRPGDVRWAVGCIILLDVIGGGADFRFRLFGSVCQSVYGVDVTGLLLSDLERLGHLAGARTDYTAVVTSRTPLFRPGKVVWPNGRELAFGRILVPFVDKHDAVCRIVLTTDSGMPAEDVIMLCGQGVPRFVQDDADGPPARPSEAAA